MAVNSSGVGNLERDWLSISAAARALGVSSSTLRLWASEGRIPHVRTAGGHRRFDPETLRGWLAEQPVRSVAARRRAAIKIDRSPDIARVLLVHVDRIAEIVDGLVEGPVEAAFRQLAPQDRVAAVRAWLDLLADAFMTGSLAEGLSRAGAYGRGHGLAGSSAEVSLGGSLALERAVERALGRSALSATQRQQVGEALGRLTARVASGWAAAVAGRPEEGQ